MMRNLKKELIEYGRKIYADRFVIGSGGNISARVGSKIYIKASGVSLERSKAADYNEVDLNTGKAICGRGPCSIEIPMHLACYKARPDIGAVIHAHPVYGTIVGITEKSLGAVSYELVCALGSKVPVIRYIKSGSVELAEAVGRAIKKENAVLLKNHGAIVVGSNLKEAYERSVVLERSCKIYVLAKLDGKVSLIS